MTTMARLTLLTTTQRHNLMAFPHPTETRLIARYYLLSPQDITIIQRQQSPENQLAFALHLCVLRYPGRIWRINEVLPEYLIQVVAQQLALRVDILSDYTHDPELRRSQLRTLRQHFHFRLYNETTKALLHDWILPTVTSTHKTAVIMNILIVKMRQERIIIPKVITLEEFLHPIIQQANKKIYNLLAGELTNRQKQALDLLLSNRGQIESSYRTWLQAPPGAVSLDNLLALMDRLTFIRNTGLSTAKEYAVNPNRLSQLAREAERLSAWRLRRKTGEERYALLVAFVLQQTGILIDQILEMFLLLYHQVFKKAKNAQTQRFVKDGKTINQHLHQYKEIGKALIAARKRKQEAFEALDAILTWTDFIHDIEQVETLVRPKNFDFLELVGNRYSYIRRFSPTLLQSFEFQGQDETRELRHGLRLICEVDKDERPTLPEWTPADFVDSRWKPYVFADSKLQRSYYELCALSKLRDNLRSGDMWVDESHNFRHLSDFLIPDKQWQKTLDAKAIPVAVPLDPLTYLRQRHELLHEQLQIVDEGLANRRFPDVEFVDDRLKIKRTTIDIPSDMKRVKNAVYKLLPHIRITDLLLEVDDTVNFSQYFTHSQTEERLDDPVLLCTTLLAGAINLGVEKMAIASHHTSYNRLAWVADWFIRDDTYSKALAQIVHFQMANPFAYYWGSGTTSSSDSQYFPVGGTKSAAAHRNPYYGTEPGIAFYTHVSDQHSPFYTQVISTRVREAPYMLNGLLHHDTQLDIHRHSTDTKGFTDQIFALCHLLGFSFAPRIRGFKDLKLFPIKQKKFYPTLKPLLGARINTDFIYHDWLDMLRIASSLKLGTVTSPIFVQRLAAYPKQNRWAKTLKQIGRLERTFFSLQWIQDKVMRQQVFQALYKGEARNGLARAVCIHRLGRIRDRSLDDQRYRASALNLVVSAIILWNTIYIEQAVNYLREQGWQITEQHLNHLTPLGWEHISLTGDYVWDTQLKTNLTKLRDLRT